LELLSCQSLRDKAKKQGIVPLTGKVVVKQRGKNWKAGKREKLIAQTKTESSKRVIPLNEKEKCYVPSSEHLNFAHNFALDGCP